MILLAITPEKSLYVMLRREIGRQFFKNSRGLLPLGKIVTISSFCDVESSLFLILQLKDLTMNAPMFFKKN